MRPLSRFRILFFLSLASGAGIAFASAQTTPAVAKVEQSEEAYRAERMDQIRKAIDAADIFAMNGDYAKAEDRYLYVIKNVDRNSPIGQSAYNRAVVSIAQVNMLEGQEAEKKGDFDGAILFYKKALAADPSNEKAVRRALARLDDAKQHDKIVRRDPEKSEKNPVITPEFKQQVADVQRLLFEGDRFFETGQYAEADVRYRNVLTIDPYNKAAQQKIERLEKYRYHAAETARDATRKEAMYQVDARWTEREIAESKASAQDPVSVSDTNIVRIQKKLNEIIIDNVSFNNTPVDDAFRLLAEKVRAADPDKQGLNFVLKLQPTVASASRGGDAGAPAKKGAAPAPAPAAAAPTPVTFTLNNSSLAEVLRLLTQLAHMRWKIDEYAINVYPEKDAPDVMSTRTFVVPTGFFQARSTGAGAPASGTGGSDASKVSFDVKQQLIDQGVDFPAGATATFLAESSRLIVSNTSEQIDLIDALIQAQSKEETPMVEIETKFAEFTDDAMRELSFNWATSFQGPTSALALNQGLSGVGVTPTTLTSSSNNSLHKNEPGVLAQTALRGHNDMSGSTLDSLLAANGGNAASQTNSGASLLLGGTIQGQGVALLVNMIDQLKGVDLLLAPKVTTKNGSKARVEVTREMTYPTRVEKPSYSSTGLAWDQSEGTAQVIVVTPPALSEFKTPKADLGADVGIQMEIKPTAYPNRLIDLEITKLTVVDFEGFVNYGSTINQGDSLTSNIDILSTYKIPKPVFNSRSLTTQLQVLDGETIALGGLIREETEKINDSVPVLGDIPVVGRLFQSKVDRKIKKNLIVFVTARIVRSTGKPKYAETIVAAPVPAPAQTQTMTMNAAATPAATPVSATATP
ncbi:hypothetical protein [Verrucomicrobium sp. GAS474]|uniref:hypothetical protein n=1 Tax=Verrucomicrobium sp. GAS474 TaxID=1882831 RepID=UPI0012FF9C5D|nr:hypothetical protein [Verrucomicrobium sp. GAS474]